MVAGEGDWETMENIDDSALQVVLGREAVVRIVPRSIHGEVDTLDESLIVAVEKMVDVVRYLNIEKGEVVVEEEHEREHAV
jgi:hypothetical protein